MGSHIPAIGYEPGAEPHPRDPPRSRASTTSSELSIALTDYVSSNDATPQGTPRTFTATTDLENFDPNEIQQTLNQIISITHQIPIVFIQNRSAKKKKNHAGAVCKTFVGKFNKHIGDTVNENNAKMMLQKMRILGGLESSTHKVKIPDARMGFCILAQLNHPEYKMEALNCLEELLDRDEEKEETSIGLVSLAIELMKSMNRELLQTEILNVQIKIAQIYNKVAVLLQRHYVQGHINAITNELKSELKSTAKALRDLNRLENIKLAYEVKSALEGMHRLKDDRKELFDVAERFFNLLMAGSYVAAASQGDLNAIHHALKSLVKTFKGLDPHLPNAWYNGIQILKRLSKDAYRDQEALARLQVIIQEKYKDLNWKFSYAAMDILCDIALKGESLTIRKQAFFGIKTLDLIGLSKFADIDELTCYPDFSPMVHLKKPRLKNPNAILRQACVKHLIAIADNAPDEEIKKRAQLILKQQRQAENTKHDKFPVGS